MQVHVDIVDGAFPSQRNKLPKGIDKAVRSIPGVKAAVNKVTKGFKRHIPVQGAGRCGVNEREKNKLSSKFGNRLGSEDRLPVGRKIGRSLSRRARGDAILVEYGQGAHFPTIRAPKGEPPTKGGLSIGIRYRLIRVRTKTLQQIVSVFLLKLGNVKV